MSYYVFDCSMFAKNDPELAKEVYKVMTEDGLLIEGLSNVKLGWAQAKGLVRRHGKLYTHLKNWSTIKKTLRNRNHKQFMIEQLEDYLTDEPSYNKFYTKLQKIMEKHEGAKRLPNNLKYSVMEGWQGMTLYKRKLNVYFDIETFKYNKHEAGQKGVSYLKGGEYIVALQFRHGKKLIKKTFSHLKLMIDYLANYGETHHKSFNLFAHNGEGFDFSYLMVALKEDFGFYPYNMFLSQSVNHTHEYKLSDLKRDGMIVSHVKAKSKTRLEFKIGSVYFNTTDTYPKFMLSIKSIGEKLVKIGVYETKNDFNEADYTRYDISNDLELAEKHRYQNKLYKSLPAKTIEYCMEDVTVLREGCEHYSEIMNGYDFSNRTLSVGIQKELTSDEDPEKTAYQILRQLPQKMVDDLNLQERRLHLSDYVFRKRNGKYQTLYDYIRPFYKGGLNIYNQKHVNKRIIKKIKHLDINSSYPTQMVKRDYPGEMVDYGTEETMITLDKKYLYLLEVEGSELDKVLSKCHSRVFRQQIVKYYHNGPDESSVYITDTTWYMIQKALGKKKIGPKSKRVPIKSFIKFERTKFAGRKVLTKNYNKKVRLKKEIAMARNNEDFDRVADLSLQLQNTKVTLNGVYGIPALRPFFPLFELVDNDYINLKDDEGHLGFKNSERNILFSVFVTTYALEYLLRPLLSNVDGIDDGFLYADTDSLFVTEEFWESIKKDVTIHPTDLGAWDMEHDNIEEMFILNHKKYAIQYIDKNGIRHLDVHCGGVKLSDLHIEKYDNLADFVKEVFHEGAEVKTQRSIMTHQGTVCIYEGIVELQAGGNYQDKFNPYENAHEKALALLEYYTMMDYLEDESNENGIADAIYTETPYGTFSPADLSNTSPVNQDTIDLDNNMKAFMEDEELVYQYLEGEEETQWN